MVINVKMAEESVDSPAKSLNLMEKLKFLENDRIKTFQHWKHNDSQNCSIKKMAQAGFFYSGLNSDDDSATCFVCGKDLDGWEPTDDPFTEHEKHAPNCQFVKLRKCQDDLTVAEFFDISGTIVKKYLTTCFNKKITAFKKKSEEVREKIKNQQF